MTGVKGRSGGARAGAGRKRRTTVVEQASRRSIVLEVFDEEAWRDTVKAWLLLAPEMPSVIYPLLPYILGGVKQDVNVTGQIEHQVTITSLRQALGIIDVTPTPLALRESTG